MAKNWREHGVVLSLGVALWLVWMAIFLRYMPNQAGALGHDYALHLPNLLAGYYWFLGNGAWATPWFTPAECGGMAYYSDPNVAYFALPQLLSFWVAPLRAIQITFAGFALAGFLGAYGLMRRSFGASGPAALLAGGLFLFNGFYAYRLLAGHLTFHAFALAPALALALLPGPKAQPIKGREAALRVVLGALIMSYMFQSGMVHGIPPVLLSIATLFLVHGLLFGWRGAPWALSMGAGVVTLALCAARLNAELALLANFPRSLYPLPGVDNPVRETFLLLRALAGFAGDGGYLVNSPWTMQRHEWEYGVSLGAFALLLALPWRPKRLPPEDFKRPSGASRALAWVAIALAMVAPLAFNFYQPGWTDFLKSLPYFGSSSSLLRFFSAYILVLVVCAGLALDRLATSGRARWFLAGLALGVTLIQNLASPKEFYAGQNYDPAPVEAAWLRAEASGEAPPIDAVAVNGNLWEGQSRLNCYQPLFGYRLEVFPKGALRSGAITLHNGDALNLKNPACYVFPGQNACRPGDAFKIAQSDKAESLAHYRPFEFAPSHLQILAGWVSAGAQIAAAVALALLALGARFPRSAAITIPNEKSEG